MSRKKCFLVKIDFFVSPRYLGSAITPGAVYLSSNDGGRITVYCCKGSMEDPLLVEMDDTDDKENFQMPMPSKSWWVLYSHFAATFNASVLKIKTNSERLLNNF